MTHLLKAMGFWIWGLLAVVLSVCIVTVSYRMSTVARGLAAHDFAVRILPRESADLAGSSTQKAPTVSRVIAQEMTAAQIALQAGDWNTALKNVDAAASKYPLTAFDKKTIAEFRGYVYIKLHRLKDAQAAYEAAIATGAYPGEELAKVDRTLFTVAAQNADYAQTIALGTQLADANNATANDLSTIAQAYFVQKDCPKAALWVDRAIAASLKAGIAPKENDYLFKLQCAADSRSNTAMATVLYDLIRLTHKRAHWNTLLRIERQDLHDDHNTMLVDRLMYDTGAMTQDTDFIELARLLSDRGHPSEALMVLKSLMASNYLKFEHRESVERQIEPLTRRVDADPDNLNPDVVRALLLAHASEDASRTFGAPTAIERTATRGELERPDELNLYIARVLIVQGDFVGARAALQKFIGLSNPSVGRLWKLYADTLPESVPANST